VNDQLSPVLTIDESTYVFGVFLGSVPAGGLMMTIYRLPDERLVARGRIRVHRDDKLWNSEDVKHVLSLTSRPGTSPGMFKTKVLRKLRRLVRELKSTEPLSWVPVHGDGEALVKALERAALKDSNLRISYMQKDDPE
jgi:hypothetical protein